MDDSIKLAEAYYMVAAHLQREGQRLLDIAELLDHTADKICEQNMRVTTPDSAESQQNITGDKNG